MTSHWTDSNENIMRVVPKVAENLFESKGFRSASRFCFLLRHFPPGGYLQVWRNDLTIAPVLIVGLGDAPPEIPNHHWKVGRNRAQSLRGFTSSHLQIGEGAVRAGNMTFSFCGLGKSADEIFLLLLVVYCQLATIKEIYKVANSETTWMNNIANACLVACALNLVRSNAELVRA